VPLVPILDGFFRHGIEMHVVVIVRDGHHFGFFERLIWKHSGGSGSSLLVTEAAG
jgi:hypothetical protein